MNGDPLDTQDQQPRTKEAARMSDTNERSVASDGSVAGSLADGLRGISDSLNVVGNDFSDILYPLLLGLWIVWQGAWHFW